MPADVQRGAHRVRRGVPRRRRGEEPALPAEPVPDRGHRLDLGHAISQIAQDAWLAEPELAAWIERSRLNAARGINDHMDDPLMQSALARMFKYAEPAVANLEAILPQSQ